MICVVILGISSQKIRTVIILSIINDKIDYRPKERLPNAKELGETSLMFLVHPTLTEDEIKLTCDVLTGVMNLAAEQYK